MALSSILGLAKSLVFARVLGADLFGYYGIVDLIVTYGIYALSLGLLEALNRQIPFYLGSRDATQATRVARAATGALALSTAVIGGAYLVIVALLLEPWSPLWVAYVFGGILTALNLFFFLAIVHVLARRQAVRQAVILLIKSISALALGATFATWWGLPGAIGGEGLGILLATAFAVVRDHAIPAPAKPSAKVLGPVFRLGVPMVLGVFATSVGRSIDRILVVAALGAIVFSQYSFALIVFVAASVAANAIVLYATPRISFGMGDRRSLRGYVYRIDQVVAAVLALAALGAVPFDQLTAGLGRAIFPDYSVGLDLMRIMYVAAAAQIATVYQSVLVAAGAVRTLFAQAVVVALLSLAAASFVALTAPSPYAFAVVFVASRLTAAAALFVAAHRIRSLNDPVPPTARPTLT